MMDCSPWFAKVYVEPTSKSEPSIFPTPIPYGDSVKRRDADSIRSDQA